MRSIILAGAFGKMGQQIQSLIKDDPQSELKALFTHPGDKADAYQGDIPLFTSLEQIRGSYDVWIDVTKPDAVFDNCSWAIEHGISPIIGTSGLSFDQVTSLQKLAEDHSVGGIIAPNFSVSAVLAMYFSKIAGRFMKDVSITEIHHPDKVDAPSGTAKATAQLLAQAGAKTVSDFDDHDGQENIINDVKILSKRKAGYVAYQSVDFKGQGESLQIAQNSFDRKSFMEGVKMALYKVDDQKNLVFGLEKIMGLE
ncbi:4-hydroxy-tetrahydrodipicolinate reductase [Oenococcus alcoholitolerans]|uniref:4-hydroxy-tetrahydrodipicolinate reductase n=1 Tax=Oenococcus alcoholitolerans TaxID=931074 RepID=UPI003F70C88F